MEDTKLFILPLTKKMKKKAATNLLRLKTFLVLPKKTFSCYRHVAANLKLWQSTREQNFNKNSMQRHQSGWRGTQVAIRAWRSNYTNFILGHSKISHRWRCRTSRVWGSSLWLFSHHEGDSIRSASKCRPAPLYLTNKRGALTGRYGRKLVVENSSYWSKPRASRHPDRSPNLYSRSASFVQMAWPPARQGTAHSASATCFCVIYLNSILNVHFQWL